MADGATKRLPYLLLLLVFLTAAWLSVIVMHKVREQRVFAVLIQERDGKVISLRALLQKEKAYNKETKRKVEEMKATTSSLRTQKTDLKTKLKRLEATATNLKTKQKELEAFLKEKDSHISQMEESTTNLQNTRKELEACLKEQDSLIKQMEEKATDLQNTQKEQDKSLHSRNLDSDCLRSNRQLKKENNKVLETEKNGTVGHLEEKISKDSLSNDGLSRPKQRAQEMAGAADVKPKVHVNDDATQQKNKRQKSKKSKSNKTKMINTPAINVDGEVTKRKISRDHLDSRASFWTCSAIVIVWFRGAS
ncbi:hypothetical protein ACQ4PT_047879 [Festuca glaucescens]